MSKVIAKDGTEKEVENLGWLLKHWQEVEWFEVHTYYPSIHERDKPRYWDCWLVAHMQEGIRYKTEFADKSVLWDWLNRPKFRGLPVKWFGAIIPAGGLQWTFDDLKIYDPKRFK